MDTKSTDTKSNDTKSTVCTSCNHEHKNEDKTCACGCSKETTETK